MEIRDIALVIIVSSLPKIYTQNKMFTCGETWSETFGIKLFFSFFILSWDNVEKQNLGKCITY